MYQFNCFKCSAIVSWSAQFPVSRRDSCPKCGSDTRVCRNCRHYDPSARSECREHVAEPIRDKERANLCDAFQAKQNPSGGAAGDSKEDLLKNAEALFKKN